MRPFQRLREATHNIADRVREHRWQLAGQTMQVAAGTGTGYLWFSYFSRADSQWAERGIDSNIATSWFGISYYTLLGIVAVDGLVKIAATCAGNQELGVKGPLGYAIEGVQNTVRTARESFDNYTGGPGWQRG